MMYFRMLRLEVATNRKRLLLLFSISVGIAFVMCVSFYSWYYKKALVEDRIIPSFWDQLVYFYRGIPPFTPSWQESFEMPIAYLITNLVLLFALGNTTASVFEPYGYEIFTRIPNRSVWWLAHCLMAVIAAIVEQTAIIGTIMLFCLAVGGPFAICDYRGLAIPELVSWPGTGYMQVLSLLLSPVLAAIALALLQLLLELVAGDTLGLIFAIAFVVSGAFLDEPILFCGHAMMQRLSAFTGDGITMKQTTLWTGVISALSIIVGARHLSKKDLIR